MEAQVAIKGPGMPCTWSAKSRQTFFSDVAWVSYFVFEAPEWETQRSRPQGLPGPPPKLLAWPRQSHVS